MFKTHHNFMTTLRKCIKSKNDQMIFNNKTYNINNFLKLSSLIYFNHIIGMIFIIAMGWENLFIALFISLIIVMLLPYILANYLIKH